MHTRPATIHIFVLSIDAFDTMVSVRYALWTEQYAMFVLILSISDDALCAESCVCVISVMQKCLALLVTDLWQLYFRTQQKSPACLSFRNYFRKVACLDIDRSLDQPSKLHRPPLHGLACSTTFSQRKIKITRTASSYKQGPSPPAHRRADRSCPQRMPGSGKKWRHRPTSEPYSL